MRIVFDRIGLYPWHAHYRKAFRNFWLCLGLNKQLFYKQMLPGIFIDEFYLETILWICSGINIGNI